MYGWKTDGLMDEIKIYPYARNAEQINADYVVGASKIGSKAVIGEKAGAVPAASLPSKLIAHWQFNEGSGTTVNDTSGQNNHGTIISNASWTNSGKSGKALIFDGAAARIQNIPPTPFEYRGQDYSISLWYKRGNSDDQSNLLSKPWNGSGQYNYRIYLSSTDSLFFYLQGASFWSTQIDNFSTREEWTHLGITLNATSKEVKIYRNGKLIQTTTHNISDWTPTSGNSNLSLCIGSLYPYGSSWTGNTTFSFEGSLDEIKFYNSTLSPEEMLQDYNFGMSTIMGQSPESPAGTTGSAASEYCVPGDTNPCAPPVAEWNFNENQGTVISDLSGNNLSGTLVNTNNDSWTKGNNGLGSALSLNGSNQYIEFGNVLNMELNDWTISGWIKKTSNPSSNQHFLSKSRATSQNYRYSVGVGTNGGIRVFMQGDGGADVVWNGNIVVTDGNWHYITVIYDRDSEAKLYVDGVFDSSMVISQWQNANMVSNNPFRLGSYTASDNITPSALFQGELDQFRVYNYARSPAQIAWDYNRGAPVAHWRLDECQGNVAHDASSNNLHGIININSSGSQNALGTCTSGNATEAWYNGREGIFGSSLSFDGTDDYIDLGNDSGIRDFADQITVSAWAKYNAYGGGGQSYSVIAVKGDPWTFLLENYSSKIRFRVTVGGLDKNATDSQVHELNRWYHFVGTYDGANIKIYKDGKLVGTTPATGNLAVSDVTAKIGTYQGTNYNFNGQIDDVRIYNYALTQEQIKLLYNDNAAVRF
jgi:hypothetical protein